MNCFQGTSHRRLALICTFLLGTFTSNQVYAQTADNTPKVKVFPIETVNKSTVPGKVSTFTWKDGTNLSNLIQYGAGKVIFLNFWATWCPPCRKEIPDIIELSKEFSENDVLVLGVSMDRDDEALKTVSKFVRLKNMPYTVLVGNDQVADAFDGIGAIPTTFIIKADGSISEKIVGARSKEDFKSAIMRAMVKK